jgi:hypothetical protein
MLASETETADSNEAVLDLNDWMLSVPLGTKERPLSKECSTSRLNCPVPMRPPAPTASRSSDADSHDVNVASVKRQAHEISITPIEFIFDLKK